MTLTHYKAEWVDGSDTWPLPVWPMTDISQYLFGPEKSDYHSSLILEGNFKKDQCDNHKCSAGLDSFCPSDQAG